MKRYYQGEDIPFSIDFSNQFQNVTGFSDFAEIIAYVYTDGCTVQKFSTKTRDGYSSLGLNGSTLSGLITSSFSSLFAPGVVKAEINGLEANGKSDIAKYTVGAVFKSIIKRESLNTRTSPTSRNRLPHRNSRLRTGGPTGQKCRIVANLGKCGNKNKGRKRKRRCMAGQYIGTNGG